MLNIWNKNLLIMHMGQNVKSYDECKYLLPFDSNNGLIHNHGQNSILFAAILFRYNSEFLFIVFWFQNVHLFHNISNLGTVQILLLGSVQSLDLVDQRFRFGSSRSKIQYWIFWLVELRPRSRSTIQRQRAGILFWFSYGECLGKKRWKESHEESERRKLLHSIFRG